MTHWLFKVLKPLSNKTRRLCTKEKTIKNRKKPTNHLTASMKRDHIPTLLSMMVPKLITIQQSVITIQLTIIQPSDITIQVLVTTILNPAWDIPMIMKILKQVAAVDQLVICPIIDQNCELYMISRFLNKIYSIISAEFTLKTRELRDGVQS